MNLGIFREDGQVFEFLENKKKKKKEEKKEKKELKVGALNGRTS